MNELLEAALHYAEHFKWSVIPLSPGAKIPPKYFEVMPFRERIASRQEIEAWWEENPKYNVGIITGKISNLLVVDLDKYKPQYKEENAILHFGDNINTPITETPRGGNHLYFEYPGHRITIGEGILPAIDWRGEGGYTVAPPSINGNGKSYQWIQNCDEFSRMTCPASFKDALIKKSTLYGRVTDPRDNTVTSVTECDIWEDGTRDKNLFHIAHCLTQTKNTEDYIRQTLRAIVLSWGERDEGWINAKIKSALDREERRERNIQAEVDSFISVTTGDFSVTYMDKELGCVTTRDMAAARKALSRRKDTLVEKAGTRDGWWRRIDTEIEILDFDEPEGEAHPVLLPFDLHNLVKIYEGNIILISGEFNAGKSLFGLTALVMNKNRMPIRFISSEMKVPEIKGRFKWFGVDKDCWMPDANCKYIALKNNLPALLLPDGLNIIDYLEFPEGDFTRASEYMRQIHDRLKHGVAIVCNQHKIGAKLPRSGDLIMEKPRLAVALKKLEENNDNVIGVAEILKAKTPKIGKMDGKKLKYEIKNHGSFFETLIDWGFWRDMESEKFAFKNRDKN
jgi:hypothetical protein